MKMSPEAALPERVQGQARLPFTARDRVLLVGEGDFSFAATGSLALHTAVHVRRNLRGMRHI